ncbi:MAG TPA: excinuclease ABC subunit UvrC [Candidatus Omnitrophota bacterium]|nr:excinuclease ABC subunit UvrC [Candidatus Omnitrophota bacterium]
MVLEKTIKSLPDSSGVYLMKDRDGKVIYIGKAISIKKRVGSHFAKRNSPSKQDVMIESVEDIDYIPTASETEALLLEADLIKRFKPKYNVSLRDDKTFPFIKIAKEKFPAVSICRPKNKDRALCFGPYTDSQAIRELLKKIRKIFPFRSCRSMPKKACLDFHLGLCPAPCIGKIDKKDYAKIIRSISLILKGKSEVLFKQLEEEINAEAKKRNFEEAARLRDQMLALGSIYLGSRVDNFLEEAKQLAKVLKLKKLPFRIEAFDVSNIFGKEAVGSMVSFWQGVPDKNNYRRFRIKESQGEINDYKMLAEITRRRYSRLKNEGLVLPDLVIVDGGRGQVSVVKNELDKLGLDLPLIGIAKVQEQIISLTKKDPIVLPLNSAALRLVMRIRDEAHRFAVSYHRILRRKKTFEEK